MNHHTSVLLLVVTRRLISSSASRCFFRTEPRDGWQLCGSVCQVHQPRARPLQTERRQRKKSVSLSPENRTGSGLFCFTGPTSGSLAPTSHLFGRSGAERRASERHASESSLLSVLRKDNVLCNGYVSKLLRVTEGLFHGCVAPTPHSTPFITCMKGKAMR